MEEKIGGGEVHAAILHGNIPDEAHELEQQIRGRFNCVELVTSEMGPVIGVHAGPGTLGLVFYASN
jgi:fatty acid-binding protein DegV